MIDEFSFTFTDRKKHIPKLLKKVLQKVL